MPSGEPVIGISVLSGEPEARATRKGDDDLEDEREIMMYLRHEAGMLSTTRTAFMKR